MDPKFKGEKLQRKSNLEKIKIEIKGKSAIFDSINTLPLPIHLMHRMEGEGWSMQRNLWAEEEQRRRAGRRQGEQRRWGDMQKGYSQQGDMVEEH